MRIPQWLAIVAAVVTPVSAFVGAALGHWWDRRSAREAEVWRHREETMRLLRWAVERAGEDTAEGRAAIAALAALPSSEMLQPQDLALVVAVTDALLEEPTEEYDSLAEEYDPDDLTVEVIVAEEIEAEETEAEET